MKYNAEGLTAKIGLVVLEGFAEDTEIRIPKGSKMSKLEIEQELLNNAIEYQEASEELGNWGSLSRELAENLEDAAAHVVLLSTEMESLQHTRAGLKRRLEKLVTGE